MGRFFEHKLKPKCRLKTLKQILAKEPETFQVFWVFFFF